MNRQDMSQGVWQRIWVAFVLAAGLTFALATGPAQAAEALLQLEETDEFQPADDEAKAQEIVDRLQNLVLSQQRLLARELIDEYSETRSAKVARELLDELELYDAENVARRQRELERTAWIRNFWDARRAPAPELPDLAVTITNGSDEAAIFQIRGPSMDWSRPMILAVGETNILKYPARFRRFTKQGTVRYSLELGQRYVFLKDSEDEIPRLHLAD